MTGKATYSIYRISPSPLQPNFWKICGWSRHGSRALMHDGVPTTHGKGHLRSPPGWLRPVVHKMYGVCMMNNQVQCVDWSPLEGNWQAQLKDWGGASMQAQRYMKHDVGKTKKNKYGLVFGSLVSWLKKDYNQTGPRPQKTGPAVQSFYFWNVKTAKTPVNVNRSFVAP